MRRFRRARLRLPVWIRWSVLVVACAYLAVRLAELLFLAPLAAIAENEARLKAIDAVNRIVLGSVGNSVRYEDLIAYEKDQQGRIAAYHVNTRYINQIASEAATAVRDQFTQLSRERFDLPLGAATGSRLLGTLGPPVPVTMLPVGTVTIDLKQEFQAEGINQTRHRLWLQAMARVRVVMPLMSQEVAVSTEMPITETVIVGPVPSSFFGGSLGSVTVPAEP